MRFFEDKCYRKIAIVISIPMLLVAQYYLFKVGILKPMVKGVEIQIVEGNYVKEFDRFVMRVNETITLSGGDYKTIPGYSKGANIWFKSLEDTNNGDDNILDIVDGNKITANKTGTTSIGIMKDERVLKKVGIKVVQNVESITPPDIIGDMRYVGDKAEIEAVVETTYNFQDEELIEYMSSDESIISVEGNEIEAVGVGAATLYARSGDKEESIGPLNITAKIDRIDIASEIEIEIGETKKLQPNIITSPKGLDAGEVSYELVDRKLGIERAISLGPDGTVTGLREGDERVRILCGDKHEDVIIRVVDESTDNDKIENLRVEYNVEGEEVIINLSWDYIQGIDEYNIYLRENFNQGADFTLFKEVIIQDDLTDTNRVSATIKLALVDGEIPDVSLYVVGKTATGYTGRSEIVNIKEEISDKQVKNLKYAIIDNSIRLTWDSIDMSGVMYSIYIKDNMKDEDEFTMYQNSIIQNEFEMPIEGEQIDIEVYVIASRNGIYSKQSETINISYE